MAQRNRAATLLLVLAFALLAVLVLACCGAALANAHATPPALSAAEDAGRGFRCFRPFSQLRSFTGHDMQSRETCDFAPFMRLLDARADVACTDKGGCHANVSFAARRYDAAANNLPKPDSMRYTVELRAVGSSTVKYKGFDNGGYSACCALVHEAECEWVDALLILDNIRQEQKQEQEQHGHPHHGAGDGDGDATASAHENVTHKELVMRHCALHDAAYDARIVDGRRVYRELHGSVSKPLHRRIPGEWEARVDFFRGTTAHEDGIGRFIVKFTVPRDDSAGGGDHSESEAVAVVATPAEE